MEIIDFTKFKWGKLFSHLVISHLVIFVLGHSVIAHNIIKIYFYYIVDETGVSEFDFD